MERIVQTSATMSVIGVKKSAAKEEKTTTTALYPIFVFPVKEMLLEAMEIFAMQFVLLQSVEQGRCFVLKEKDSTIVPQALIVWMRKVLTWSAKMEKTVPIIATQAVLLTTKSVGMEEVMTMDAENQDFVFHSKMLSREKMEVTVQSYALYFVEQVADRAQEAMIPMIVPDLIYVWL